MNRFSDPGFMKKLYLTAVIIGYIVILAISIMAINKKPYSQLAENMNAYGVVLKGDTKTLYDSSTKDDYSTFINRLQNYINWQDAPLNSEIIIKSVEYPIRVGSLYKVVVDIPSINQTNLLITYDYSAGENGEFSVPSKNYKTDFYTN